MNSKEQKSMFQFSNPILLKSLFISGDIDKYEDFDNYELMIHFETNVKSIGDRQAEVRLRVFNVDLKNIDDTDSIPYILDVMMGAKFQWDDSIKNPDSLLRENAPALLFSYIRPYISMVTGMSQFERADIPFVDFTNNKKKDN